MISTKGRYAIRVMIDLAENDNGSYIPLKDIAARQDKLLRKPEEYTIGEIIELMEGSMASVACLAEGAVPCPRAKTARRFPCGLSSTR